MGAPKLNAIPRMAVAVATALLMMLTPRGLACRARG